MNLYAFAQSTEKSGVRFYQAMADCARKDGVKKVFRMLAHDEELLLERLEKMSKRHPEMSTMECSFLDSKAIVFEKLNKDTLCNHVDSDLEAYEVARDAERDIYRQYLNAARTEKDPDLQKMLFRIAAMERHELNELESLYDFVNAPNESLEWGEFSNLDEFHNFGR